MLEQLGCGKRLPAVSLVLALLCGGVSVHLQAQAGVPAQQDTSVKAPAYDIVSIKPSDPSDRNVGWKSLPNGFDYKNLPLALLIYQAYGISLDSQVSGLPPWAKTDHYNISARVDDNTAEAWKKLSQDDIWKQQQDLLQTLFADRCQLKMQREIKELPVYDLVIARGGSRMKEAPPDKKGSVDLMSGSFFGEAGQGVEYTMTMTASSVTAQGLAQNLSHYAGRIVVDKTSLGDKKFDFELKWSTSDQAPRDRGDTGPSLFKALEEQLGLKLEPAKEPVDTFVVEHIERPSAN